MMKGVNFDGETGKPLRETCFNCEASLSGPVIGPVGTPGICQICLRRRPTMFRGTPVVWVDKLPEDDYPPGTGVEMFNAEPRPLA